MANERPRDPSVSSRVATATIAWLVWATPCQAATTKLLKGPYLTGLSESGVEVRFETDGPSDAAIEVRSEQSDGGAARTFDDHSGTTMHVVRAVGLEAAARHRYVVRLGGAAVGDGHFTTAPRRGVEAPLSFLVYGDDRTDPVAHAAVVRAISTVPSDILVNTGDLVEDGARAADWQAFFDVEGPLLRNRTLFVAIGNHELYEDSAGANFARYFGFFDGTGAEQVFGTVRLSNVRFFFLNAMHDWGSGDERRWLEAELARADDEPGLVWRIAVMHQGPWSSGPHGPNANIVAAHIPELLETHKVDLILSGHDHIYERGASGTMRYIVSGGGGAPLYRIAQRVPFSRKAESAYHFVEVTTALESVRIVAHRIDGSVLDRCGFTKGLAWDCDGPAGVLPLAQGDAPAAGVPPTAAVPEVSPRCGCIAVGARDTRRRVGGSIVLACALVLGAARCRRFRGNR